MPSANANTGISDRKTNLPSNWPDLSKHHEQQKESRFSRRSHGDCRPSESLRSRRIHPMARSVPTRQPITRFMQRRRNPSRIGRLPSLQGDVAQRREHSWWNSRVALEFKSCSLSYRVITSSYYLILYSNSSIFWRNNEKAFLWRGSCPRLLRGKRNELLESIRNRSKKIYPKRKYSIQWLVYLLY